MSSLYDDMESMKIEDFIGRIQHYKSYKKGVNNKTEHCSDCVWVLSKLNAMYKKTEEYARMRKTDDDKIEWDTLILEVLDMPDEAQTIQGPSPAKKQKMVQQPKKMEETPEAKKLDGFGTRLDDMMHRLAEAAQIFEVDDLDFDMRFGGSQNVAEDSKEGSQHAEEKKKEEK